MRGSFNMEERVTDAQHERDAGESFTVFRFRVHLLQPSLPHHDGVQTRSQAARARAASARGEAVQGLVPVQQFVELCFHTDFQPQPGVPLSLHFSAHDGPWPVRSYRRAPRVPKPKPPGYVVETYDPVRLYPTSDEEEEDEEEDGESDKADDDRDTSSNNSRGENGGRLEAAVRLQVPSQRHRHPCRQNRPNLLFVAIWGVFLSCIVLLLALGMCAVSIHAEWLSTANKRKNIMTDAQWNCSTPIRYTTLPLTLPFDIQDNILFSAAVLPALILGVPDPVSPGQGDSFQAQPTQTSNQKGEIHIKRNEFDPLVGDKSPNAIHLENFRAHHPPAGELMELSSAICNMVSLNLKLWVMQKLRRRKKDAVAGESTADNGPDVDAALLLEAVDIIPGGHARFGRLCQQVERAATRAASSWLPLKIVAADTTSLVRAKVERAQKDMEKVAKDMDRLTHPDDMYFIDLSFRTENLGTCQNCRHESHQGYPAPLPAHGRQQQQRPPQVLPTQNVLKILKILYTLVDDDGFPNLQSYWTREGTFFEVVCPSEVSNGEHGSNQSSDRERIAHLPHPICVFNSLLLPVSAVEAFETWASAWWITYDDAHAHMHETEQGEDNKIGEGVKQKDDWNEWESTSLFTARTGSRAVGDDDEGGSQDHSRETNLIGIARHVTTLAALIDDLLATIDGIPSWWVAESGKLSEDIEAYDSREKEKKKKKKKNEQQQRKTALPINSLKDRLKRAAAWVGGENTDSGSMRGNQQTMVSTVEALAKLKIRIRELRDGPLAKQEEQTVQSLLGVVEAFKGQKRIRDEISRLKELDAEWDPWWSTEGEEDDDDSHEHHGVPTTGPRRHRLLPPDVLSALLSALHRRLETEEARTSSWAKFLSDTRFYYEEIERKLRRAQT